MIRFSATIRKVGINPCVAVPARVSRAFQRVGYVPIHAHLERGVVAATLVPLGRGRHRLYINARMLRLTDARVGRKISLGVELDESDRTLPVPADIQALLRADARAATRWAALAPSRRKEIIRYLSFAKTAETRKRNLARLAKILRAKFGAGVLSGIRIPSRQPAG